jgi:hypothetical protein
VVDDDAVVGMRRVAEERVVARALLAHEHHERVGESAPHVGPDAHGGRRVRAGAHDVASAPPHPAEVEPPGLDARAQRTVAARRQRAEHRAAALVLDGEPLERDRSQRADDGDLRRIGEIADLVDAHECRAVGRRGLRGGDARDHAGECEQQGEPPRAKSEHQRADRVSGRHR